MLTTYRRRAPSPAVASRDASKVPRSFHTWIHFSIAALRSNVSSLVTESTSSLEFAHTGRAQFDTLSMALVFSSYLIAIGPSFPQRKVCIKPGMVHYTCVSSDYRVRTLRRVLDTTIEQAPSFGEETS